MDQEKIGRFIATSRKKKNMTQEELAEKLNVNNRTISRWENGKNMPDISLYKELCEELEITINELLSGQKLEDENYQEKFEENIIKVIVDDKKKTRRKIKLVLIVSLILLLIISLVTIIYNTIELDVWYTSNMMTCRFDGETLIYQEVSSVYNTNYVEKIVDNNKYLFFHSTVSLKNKKRSEWEFRENLSNHISNQGITYSSGKWIEQEKGQYENIFVYYTNKQLKDIEKSTSNDMKNILKNSYLICSYN